MNISGFLSRQFITSPLTPLLLIASLILGGMALIALPREEEPQIVVPMADVWLSFPGASAKIVEEQLTKPFERKISEIKGVEYVYSTSRPGGALRDVEHSQYVGGRLSRESASVANLALSQARSKSAVIIENRRKWDRT